MIPYSVICIFSPRQQTPRAAPPSSTQASPRPTICDVSCGTGQYDKVGSDLPVTRKDLNTRRSISAYSKSRNAGPSSTVAASARCIRSVIDVGYHPKSPIPRPSVVALPELSANKSGHYHRTPRCALHKRTEVPPEVESGDA